MSSEFLIRTDLPRLSGKNTTGVSGIYANAKVLQISCQRPAIRRGGRGYGALTPLTPSLLHFLFLSPFFSLRLSDLNSFLLLSPFPPPFSAFPFTSPFLSHHVISIFPSLTLSASLSFHSPPSFSYFLLSRIYPFRLSHLASFSSPLSLLLRPSSDSSLSISPYPFLFLIPLPHLNTK